MDTQIRYFLAVVDEHNFTRAAVKCHISQSAISQQIKELEDTLGVQLIDRHGRSFSLTAAGHYFYQHCQQIITDLDHLVESTREIAKQQAPAKILRIGYFTDLGTKELLNAVAEFSASHPDISIQLTSGDHEKLFHLLREGKIDLNFADQRRALSPHYHNLLLANSKLLAVVPKQTFRGQKSVTTADLASLPCILVMNQSSQSADAERDYASSVLGIQSRFTVANSFEEGQLKVAAGQGFIVINDLRAGAVNTKICQAIPLYQGKTALNQHYYAFWSQSQTKDSVPEFAQILQHEFA